jgi:GNAT superfamily N-acetyltransferase
MHGQGVGALLLQDAVARAYRSEVAAMAVVVDAKDETAARFYERYGFQRFAHQPMRLFLTMSDIARLLGDQA